MRFAHVLSITTLMVLCAGSAAPAAPGGGSPPPEPPFSLGQQVFPTFTWLENAPMYYWKVYERWPERWQDVVDAGLVTAPLHELSGPLIEPDDGSWDFPGDIQYSYQGESVPLLVTAPSEMLPAGGQRQQCVTYGKGGVRWLLTAEGVDGTSLSGVSLYRFDAQSRDGDFNLDADRAEWVDGQWVFYGAQLYRTQTGSAGREQLTSSSEELRLPDFDVSPDVVKRSMRSAGEPSGAMPVAYSTASLEQMLDKSPTSAQVDWLKGNKERQLQLAICALIREGASMFYLAHGRAPESYAELVESGLSPLAPGTLNPLTGKPYAGLGEPNDFTFNCFLEDAAKHKFVLLPNQEPGATPSPSGPHLVTSINALDDSGSEFGRGML